MNVIGIDPSLAATGLARVDGFGAIDVLRIPTGHDDDGLAGMRHRIRYIVGCTLRFAPGECMTVIEAPIVVRGGRGGLQLERAWLFGMLVDQLLMRGPVVQVRPKTRAKYATGNGNADKRAVLRAMRETHPSIRIVDDNVADALALLGMGARHNEWPIDGHLDRKQLDAMVAVVWPAKEGVSK